MFTVYGAAGSGSVTVEAVLTLLGEPYEVVELALWNDPVAAEAVARINPMRQIPALVLPSGELMTESAAILTWLADSHPAARLSPALDDPARPAFLRWMTYVSAQIYSLYWVRDDPSRLVADAAASAFILERTAERIAQCWRIMDAQVSPGRYLLGDRMSVLDVYVAVVSRWRPLRPRFYQEAPKMAQVVRRVDQNPRLVDFWAERFPYEGDYAA